MNLRYKVVAHALWHVTLSSWYFRCRALMTCLLVLSMLADKSATNHRPRCPSAVIDDDSQTSTTTSPPTTDHPDDVDDRSSLSSSHPTCTCNQFHEIRCTGGLRSLPRFPQPLDSDFDDGDGGRPSHHYRHSYSHIWNAFIASGQKLEVIEPWEFELLPSRRVVLNFNPFDYRRMPSEAFWLLGKTLVDLRLGACRLLLLPPGLLHRLYDLERLELWANGFDMIPQKFFAHSYRLRELSMWGNQLDELDELTFEGLEGLRRIDLDRNKIRLVSQNTFHNTPELECLRLSGNEIHVIHSDTFARLPNIKVNIAEYSLLFVE